MNFNDLSMLSDDQIDYEGLPDDTLAKLVLGQDLFVANSALGMLARRKRPVAARLATDILEKTLGDRFLQAAAISVLFDMDHRSALATMARKMKEFDPYVLNSILELMIHNRDYFQGDDGLLLIDMVSDRLREIPRGEKWPCEDVRDEFSRLYGRR